MKGIKKHNRDKAIFAREKPYPLGGWEFTNEKEAAVSWDANLKKSDNNNNTNISAFLVERICKQLKQFAKKKL